MNAHDFGVRREQVMAFLAGDDTHVDMIRLSYRRWLEEVVPRGTLPSEADLAAGREQMARLLGAAKPDKVPVAPGRPSGAS